VLTVKNRIHCINKNLTPAMPISSVSHTISLLLGFSQQLWVGMKSHELVTVSVLPHSEVFLNF